MTPSNRQRADRCQQAITAYSDDDDHSNLVDFLADAQHWCDANGEDFHISLAMAWFMKKAQPSGNSGTRAK